MYIHRALLYLQNVLTEFSYLLINLWHLALTFKLGSRQRKYPWHSLINSIFEVLNNFMHIRLYVKSRECRSPLLSWFISIPHTVSTHRPIFTTLQNDWRLQDNGSVTFWERYESEFIWKSGFEPRVTFGWTRWQKFALSEYSLVLFVSLLYDSH